MTVLSHISFLVNLIYLNLPQLFILYSLILTLTKPNHMKNFITFNTPAQAQQYVKRQKSHYYNEGCGCCHNSSYVSINKDRVLSYYNYICGEHQGTAFCQVSIIGKIKKNSKV